MREDFLFHLMATSRGALLKQVGKCPPDKRNVIPVGFNNSLHWQLGHIVTVTDGLVFGKSGEGRMLPAEYKTFFEYGTRPSSWIGEPPSWDEICTRTNDQVMQLRSVFAGRLDAKAMANPFKGETVGDLLLFNLYHESVHIGLISAMLKLIEEKPV